MNRILRGTVLLAVSALVWGCNTEPEELQGGDPTQIVATPAVVFVDRGATNEVFVRLVDQQGTSLSSEVSVTVADPSVIQVSADSLYRPVFGPDGVLGFNTNNSELRLVVTGLTLNATSFTISAGGLTQEVEVAVVPIEIEAALSTTTPAIAETFTVTAPAGLTFSQGSQIIGATGLPSAYTIDVADDGSTLTAVAAAGSAGAMSITEVVPAYSPALTVTLPMTTSFTTSATVGAGLTGVDAAATAPVLVTLSGDTRSSGVVDVGTSYPGTDTGAGGTGVRFYRIDVAETGSYDFSLTYGSTADLGLYLYDAAGEFVGGIADGHGLGPAASPETAAEVELTTGSYTLGVVWYDYTTAAQPGPHPLPAYFTLTIVPH